MAGGSSRTTLRSDGRVPEQKLSLDGTIEHLVVVSDPRTLGEIREHFHRDLREARS
jgi:protein required for attachment to host cells